MNLVDRKSHDYADQDVLSNFKRMHELCALLGVSPWRSAWDTAMFLALLKLDRWTNLRRRGVEPENESVRDTIGDLENYIELAYACQLEED